MAPIKHEVNIGMEPLVGMRMHGKTMADYPYLARNRTLLFDNLAWWGRALKNARQDDATA